MSGALSSVGFRTWGSLCGREEVGVADEANVIEFRNVQIVEAGRDLSSTSDHEVVLEIAPGERLTLTCTKETAKWAGAHLFTYHDVRVVIGGA